MKDVKNGAVKGKEYLTRGWDRREDQKYCPYRSPSCDISDTILQGADSSSCSRRLQMYTVRLPLIKFPIQAQITLKLLVKVQFQEEV
jgi:hypothetical protein